MADEKIKDAAKLGPVLEYLSKQSGRPAKEIEKMVMSGKKLDGTMRKLAKIRYQELTKEVSNLSFRLEELYKRQASGQRGLKSQIEATEKLRREYSGQAEAAGELSEKMAGVSSYAKMATLAIAGLTAAFSFGKEMFKRWVGIQQQYAKVNGELQKSTGLTTAQFNAMTQAAKQGADQFGRLEQDVLGYADSAEYIKELAVATKNVNRAAKDKSFRESMLMISRTTGLGVDGAVEFERALGAIGASGSREELMNLSQDFNRFSEDIGALPSETFKAFNKSKDNIARFGKAGTKVFKDVTMLATKFGIEADVIFKSMEKFDSFGAASDEVNQLNAVLGTTVSSYEMMMNTDPAQRFELLRNAVKQTGQTWESMNYFQKKAYANSIGMSEEMAARTLKEGTSLEELQKDQKKAAQEAEKRGERKIEAEAEFATALKRSSVVFEDTGRAMERLMNTIAMSMDKLFTKLNEQGVKAVERVNKTIANEGDWTEVLVNDWIDGMSVIWDFTTTFIRDLINMIGDMATGDFAKKLERGIKHTVTEFIVGPIKNMFRELAIDTEIALVSSFSKIRDKVIDFLSPISSLIDKVQFLMGAVSSGSMSQLGDIETKITTKLADNALSGLEGMIPKSMLEYGKGFLDSVKGAVSSFVYEPQNTSAVSNSKEVMASVGKTTQINNAPSNRITIIKSDVKMDGKKIGEAYVEAALGR